MKTTWLLLAIVCTAGCGGRPTSPAEPAVGMTAEEVQTAIGPPGAEQIFAMPQAPFFGPQEALTDLVEPGIEVLEWQYEQSEQVLYVWFVAGESGTLTVIALAEAPIGAVY